MWPQTRSIVMLGMNYAPDGDPLAVLAEPGRGAVSCYAQCKDYHDVVSTGLKRVAGSLARASGTDVKVFVDTAPLMEKPLARRRGSAGRASTPTWSRASSARGCSSAPS